MSKPIILLDMDETTVRTSEGWCKILKNKHGVDPDPRFMHQYDITTWYPSLQKATVLAPLQEQGFFYNLEPMPGCTEIINSWLAQDYDVRFATVVFPDCPFGYTDKLRWIQKYVPLMERRLIVFSSHDKTLLNATILVDDHPNHIRSSNAFPIIYDQPWNREHPDCKDRMRCTNWDEVNKSVNNYLKWRGLHVPRTTAEAPKDLARAVCKVNS